MGFSTEWEKLYLNKKQLSSWPWSELVALVMKYIQLNSSHKVLELGVGSGANVPFFLNAGVDFYGIDGSKAIIESLQSKFPILSTKLITADFVKEIPFNETFDVIVDRSSITHNNTKDIESCIALIYQHLKPGGLFIGVDWFSTLQSDYNKGLVEDEHTQYDFPEGFFYQLGKVHFSDEAHIRDLFKQFEFLHLDHKIVQQSLPDPTFRMARFHFVVRKTA